MSRLSACVCSLSTHVRHPGWKMLLHETGQGYAKQAIGFCGAAFAAALHSNLIAVHGGLDACVPPARSDIEITCSPGNGEQAGQCHG